MNLITTKTLRTRSKREEELLRVNAQHTVVIASDQRERGNPVKGYWIASSHTLLAMTNSSFTSRLRGEKHKRKFQVRHSGFHRHDDFAINASSKGDVK